MTKTFAHRGFALPLAALLAFAGIARADTTLEFSTDGGDPNDTGSSITAGYGSNAPGTPDVTVGYSPYLYNFSHGYGGLGGGTGFAVYSDNSDNYGGVPSYYGVFTFTAALGHTVTLESFNLAQYTTSSDQVDISVTGGSSSYSLTNVTPAGGTGNFSTYSPNVTGSSLTLTITNLYDVGINEITFSEAAVTSVPEPSSAVLAVIGGLGLVVGAAWRRRKRTA